MIEDMKLQRREPTDLWRFVNGAHSRSDAEWNGGMLFIDAVHETGALISRPAPIVEKAIYDARILEHDVVDVTVRLTIQSHGTEKERAIFLKKVKLGTMMTFFWLRPGICPSVYPLA